MPHFVRYCVPSPGPDVAAALERALSRAGRSVSARRPPTGPGSPPEPGTLRWRLRSLPQGMEFDDDGLVIVPSEPDPVFLTVEEFPPGGEHWSSEGWDLTLCRELSAETGGFVCAMDDWGYIGRHGVAMFLAGRTVEVRERMLAGGPDFGGPPLESASDTWYLHGRHTEALLDETAYWSSGGEPVRAEDWTVSPAGPFEPEPPSPGSLVVLPGAQVRAGPLAGASGPAVVLEVPGGGGPFTWRRARDGEVVAAGQGRGADALLAALAGLLPGG